MTFYISRYKNMDSVKFDIDANDISAELLEFLQKDIGIKAGEGGYSEMKVVFELAK